MELKINCGTLVAPSNWESGFMDGIFVFDLYGKDRKRWTVQYNEEKSSAYAYRMIEAAKALSFRLSPEDTFSLMKIIDGRKESIIAAMRNIVSEKLSARSSDYFCLMDRISQGSYVSLWGDGTDDRVEAIVADIFLPSKIMIRDYRLENK